MVFLFILFLSLFVLASLSFAPWVPTKRRDITRALKLADLKPGEIFYDLGCGDGRAVFTAGKEFQADARGIEIFPPLFLLCIIKKWSTRSKAKIWCKNLFSTNLSDADVVFFFGTA